jgi:hypothetical protein
MSDITVTANPVFDDASAKQNDNLNDLKQTIKAELKEELKTELSLKDKDIKENADTKENDDKADKPADKVESSCLDMVRISKDSKEEDKKVEEKKDDVEENANKDEKVVEEKDDKVINVKNVSTLSLILTICGKALQRDIAVCEENIIVILHAVMESIETLHRVKALNVLTGEQKKQLCVDCMKWIVNNQPDFADDERARLIIAIDKVVPNTIDMIVGISNGDSDLVLSLTDSMCKPLGCMPSLCMFHFRCCCM